MNGGSDTFGDPATEGQMRAARRRWTSGVAVALTRQGDGHRGATVSSFAIVSLDPAMIAVCFHQEGQMAPVVQAGRSFAISVLDRRHEPVADRFAGRGPVPDPTLAGIPHEITPSGNAVLDGSLAWFDCRVRDALNAGDHLLIVANVERIGLGVDSDDPLLYYEGRYRGIEAG